MVFATGTDAAVERETRGWRFAVSSGILGWVLDAFDFFVVVFLFDALAGHFHVSKAAVVYTLTLTLAMRPLGALLFGALADRFGRRRPLMVCVLYFSLCTVMSGLAPNFAVFVVCRAMYGIGMGGYWGIGASYAMESSPRRFRGVLSGMMQGGYPTGYLLASVAMQTLTPAFGWRVVFFAGAPVAMLIVVLTLLAPESEAWRQHRPASVGRIFGALNEHRGLLLYLLATMGLMMSLAHGTQDLYPDFLKSVPGIAARSVLGMNALYGIPILYNIGAITGSICFGHLSQKIGRRNAVMLALGIAFLSLPAWAFGTTQGVLVVGSYLMQSGVMGAIGVIPAHLNELSPDAVRSLFPGLVYQVGVLLASPATAVEFMLRDRFGYPWALAMFEASALVLAIVLFRLGPEARNRSFLREAESEPAAID
ncbi:MAG: MFS transporter [Acidobacteriaceae bacterium]|jgi:SHS family lactate transporter-like MFS transporter